MTRLESNKTWAKAFMLRHSIPTASYDIFDDLDGAMSYIGKVRHRIVMKSDKIVNNQRVFLPEIKYAGYGILTTLWVKGGFGPRRGNVVVEKHLNGREISVMCFSDGKFVNQLGSFCTRKYEYDDDNGELQETGMGAYAPPPFVDEEILTEIDRKIIQPTYDGFRSEG